MNACLLLSFFQLGDIQSLRAGRMRRLRLLTTSLWSVCTTILFVTMTSCLSFLRTNIVDEMPVFGARVHPRSLVWVGRRKTVLVISSLCSVHFLKRRRPLLLHLPTPSALITPSQVWWSVPTLALKSRGGWVFVCPGVAEISASRSS